MDIILIFVIWRSLLFITANLSSLVLLTRYDFLGKGFDSWHHAPLLWHWANFDGEHYLGIASFGYRQFENAFFPGFPGLIKLINPVFNNVLVTGFLISNLAAVILIILMYKLFQLDYSKRVSFNSLILYLCFPMAFFLGAVYSESVFLVLAVGAFLAARKKMFLLAVALAIYASFTRLVGIFLLPAIFIIWFKHSKKIIDLIPILFIPLGLFMVALYNYLYVGDPLSFFHVQSSFGANRSSDSLILLPQVLFRYIKIFKTTPILSIQFFVSFQEFFWTVVSITLLIVFFKRIKLEYFIFSLGAIIVPTLTGTLSSMPRYILAAFPLFLLSSYIRSKYLFALIALFMLILEFINLSFFVSGYFVS